MIRQAISSSRVVSRSAVPRVQTRFASGGSLYNQPTGYIFGEKPPPKGQKRIKEDWENMWYIGLFGGLAFAGLVVMYKPDTTIQTWAMAEAKKKLEASGENYKYQPSPNSGYPKGV